MLRTAVLLLAIFPALPVFSQASQENQTLHLDGLIQEALQNNPEISAAGKGWEAARERVPQAAALEDPMLGLGIVNLPTTFSLDDDDMTMKELSISQRFPFPGKRGLRREQAENEAAAAFLEIEEKSNRIVREVKTVFHDLAHNSRAREVTERNKRILEDLVRIAETRYATGGGMQQDVLQAHLEISRMVDELIVLNQKRRALAARLNSLLNRPSESPVGEPADLQSVRPLPAVEELQRVAGESNPNLRALKALTAARDKAHLLARKDLFPDVTLRFAYGQRDDGAERSRRDMLSAMAEISIPIFSRTKQDRKTAESRAELQMAEAQYLAARNEVFFMIAELASMLSRGERQLELYRTGIIPQAGLQVSSALSGYTVNRSNFDALLESQLSLHRYELEYHELLTEYEKNLAGLQMLLGGRFPGEEP